MKILLIIPTLSAGGAERVMSVLANEWHRDGHEVQFGLLAGGKPFYGIAEGIKMHVLSSPRSKPFGKLGSIVRTFSSLRSKIKEIQPDFILSFMANYNEFVLASSRGLGIPVFISDRNNPFKRLSFIRRSFKKLTYSWATGYISQTEDARHCLVDLLGSNRQIAVIANPLREVQLFPNIEREKVILNIGRMVEQKGQSDLLLAFSMLSDKSWKLRILGDGVLKDHLIELAASLGVSERIEMPGAVPNVDEHLAEASIFAFSSLYEGFPNALCEAMSAGVACISTDCPTGPSELIDDGVNGVLVTLGEPSIMAEKLSELQSNIEFRDEIAKNARKIGQELHQEKVAANWMDFIVKTLNR